MQYVRRFAEGIAGTYHLILSNTSPPKVGSEAVCGHEIKSGPYQTRPLEYGKTIGSILVCGRCVLALHTQGYIRER